MVMELPPHATHFDEPSRRTESKIKPNSGSFTVAFFASHEEMKVIVTLRHEIVEHHADRRWPAKQLVIAFPDGRSLMLAIRPYLSRIGPSQGVARGAISSVMSPPRK